MFKVLTCGLLLIAIAGCGPNDGRISISGQVEVDGKPLSGAAVAFVSENGAALSSASTDNEGKFTARVASGRNKVAVSKDDPNAPPPPSNPEETLMGVESEVKAMPKAKGMLPPKFADPNTSGLIYEIKSGMAPLVISVSSN